MADETTQAEEETSWWVFDVFADSDLPSTSFDEPLEWPETLDWGDVGGDDAELRFPGTYDAGVTQLSEPIFPPAAEVEPFAASAPPAPPAPPETAPGAAADQGEPTAAVPPLAALGGASAPRAVPATDRTIHERLPDSIWAADAKVGAAGGGLGGGTTAVMADLDRESPGGWRRRFDLRHGNAPVIALISLVSLVLLGMFLSVRARNDVPTDSSQTRTTSDRIAVQGTLNTVPLTIPNTTLGGPPSTINIADLVPAPDDATTATAPTGSGSGGSTATTAPRATGGTTATTQPSATQPTTATTAAPVNTTTPTTAAPPPVDSTTQTTRRTTTTQATPRTTIDITEYTIPGGHTIPSFTVPGRD
jgi:hypothetical protein